MISVENIFHEHTSSNLPNPYLDSSFHVIQFTPNKFHLISDASSNVMQRLSRRISIIFLCNKEHSMATLYMHQDEDKPIPSNLKDPINNQTYGFVISTSVLSPGCGSCLRSLQNTPSSSLNIIMLIIAGVHSTSPKSTPHSMLTSSPGLTHWVFGSKVKYGLDAMQAEIS